MPLNNPGDPLRITAGNYVGNNGVDRAIPHGLGATPKWVFINATVGAGANWCGHIKITNQRAYSGDLDAVRASDDTNFYVSQATCNFNAVAGGTYDWVAIS